MSTYILQTYLSQVYISQVYTLAKISMPNIKTDCTEALTINLQL